MKQYYQLFHTNGLSRSYDDYTLVNGKLVCSYSKEKNNYDEEEHNVKGTDVFVWDQGNLVEESTGKTWYRINHD